MATKVFDDGCHLCEIDGAASGPYEYDKTVVRHGERLKLYRCVDRKACAKRQANDRRAAIADYLYEVREARDDLTYLREQVARAEARVGEVIRQALTEGAGATATARAAGISRERVYQIRDGRR